MKNIFHVLLLLFLIQPATVIFAQETDSTATDSVLIDTVAVDSLQKIEALRAEQIRESSAELDSSWQTLLATNEISDSSASKSLFKFENILLTNYTGLADAFRHKPTYQVFDFFSPGYPRYIAGLNLLPHQTSFAFEGVSLNDPMSGMFNTHLLSLDGVQSIDKINTSAAGHTSIYGYDFGVNLKSPLMNYDKSYSRIMFRQGDFGYTDLDISFAQKYGKNLAIYLGGINKIYDNILNSGGETNHGFQYRGGLNYRIKPNIFLHSTYNFDRDKIELNNYSKFNLYRYRDFRQDWINHLYYITNAEKGERWQLNLHYSRIRRWNDSYTQADTFLVRRQADHYGIGLDRNIIFKKFDLKGSVNIWQNMVWGGAGFPQKLTDTGLNGDVSAGYSLNENIKINGKLKTGWLYGYGLKYTPLASIEFNSKSICWKTEASIDQRFPTRTERSFRYEIYSGNDNLKNESITSLTTDVSFAPFGKFNVAAEAGYKSIHNEILFNGVTFNNGSDRNFSYLSLESDYKFYVFTIGASGQITQAKINLSPAASASAQLRYHDAWIHGALLIDAIGNLHWYDQHNTLFYHPVTERFYWTDSKSSGYYYFSYKIAATVKSAQLYVAMDNPLSKTYQYISGYYELYRRVRFGVNWVLWN